MEEAIIQAPKSPQPPQTNSYNRQLIVLLLVILISVTIGYLLGAHKVSPQSTQLAVISKPRLQPTIVKPSPVINTNGEADLMEAIGSPVSSWKTYTSPRFTVSYPPTWNVRDHLYSDTTDSILISDLKNSESIQPGLYGHIGISINLLSGAMPIGGGWTNGTSTNPTIRAYSVNGYQGTWDEEDSEPNGKTESVLLANPNGGYVQITLPNPMPPIPAETPLYVIFSEILSTFHFISK